MENYDDMHNLISLSNNDFNLNNLENNMLTDITSTEEELLSYNDINYKSKFPFDYINQYQKPKNPNRMPKNKNNLNYNINKNQNRQIQNKEMQRFSHNPKDGFYNMMKRNQKYNNISNGLNINNNINKNIDEMDNIGNNMVHVYQPIYINNNKAKSQIIKRKGFAKNEKNDNGLNLNNMNNIYNNNNQQRNYYNNYMNRDISNPNYNIQNIHNYINKNTIYNNGKITNNNPVLKKSKSNKGQNHLTMKINNNNNMNINQRPINNNIMYNPNKNNFIQIKPAPINNNSNYNNINNARKYPINLRDNILNNANINNNRNNQIISNKNRNNNQNEEDDINLSTIAEEIIQTFKYSIKKNKVENQKIENNGNNKEFGCQAYIESEANEIKDKQDNFKNDNNNNNQKEKSKPKVEKIDEGIDIQQSLLQFIQPLAFNKTKIQSNADNSNNNINTNNNINNKLNENKKEVLETDINYKNNNININNDINNQLNENINYQKEDLKTDVNYKKNTDINAKEDKKGEDLLSIQSLKLSEFNDINKVLYQQKQSEYIPKNIDNTNGDINTDKSKETKNMKELMMEKEGKESIILISNGNEAIINENKIGNQNDEENLFGDYIDSDKELELEKEEKSKKLNRRIKIDEEKNIFYNFLKGDLAKCCQVKKGKNGQLENYVEKKFGSNIYETQIVFKIQPSIKKFDINSIKINENYKLCENMREEDIIPELYEDNVEAEEIENEKYVAQLANSLRSSIDKSLNSSINRSIQQSVNQSYADGVYNSLRGSQSRVPGGSILQRLTQCFYNS